MEFRVPRSRLVPPSLPACLGLAAVVVMLSAWPVVARAGEPEGPPPAVAGDGQDASAEAESEPAAGTAEPATAEPTDGGTTAAPCDGGGRYHRPGADVGIDLNLEGALGWVPGRDHFTGFGRARVGVLVFIEPPDPRASPVAISTGLTYDISDLSGATLGLQTELIHMGSGVWGQAGAMVDAITPSPVGMVALGWSLIGVEVQRRFYEVDSVDGRDNLNDWGIYGKLRVPISIIMRAF